MKRVVAVVVVAMALVFASYAQESTEAQILGKWTVGGDLPVQMIEFSDSECIFYMRSGITNEYTYRIDGGYIFIATSGYLYKISDGLLEIVPAFGEYGMKIILHKAK